jgi:hypothetical protein
MERGETKRAPSLPLPVERGSGGEAGRGVVGGEAGIGSEVRVGKAA